MSTPIDQISRYKGARKANSMIVDYYSADTKPTQFKVLEAYTEPTADKATSNHTRARLKVENCDTLVVSDTLMTFSINGYKPDSDESSDQGLMLYVLSKDIEAGEIVVMAVNGKKIGNISNCVPSIYNQISLVRMGRAASELDVQTSQFEALPVKSQN